MGRFFSLNDKKFTTLDEQVALLKTRKLIISDEQNAKRYLLTNNYYNIINGYSKFFPHKGDEYTKHTTFEEITRLYLFDKELKQAFLKAILEIEAHLKAVFAYRFAEAYPNIPYAYLHTSSYDSTKILIVGEMISRLSKTIKKQKRFTNTSICHYIKKYNDVPIWVLVNYLNFGELRHMILCSPVSIQNKIAKDMFRFIKPQIPKASIFPPETMLSFLANINDVRNVCAHNNRLINFNCRAAVKYWPELHDTFNINLLVKQPRRDVYTVFLSTKCFLSAMEHAALHNKIRKLINGHLRNHLYSVQVNDILATLGFPPNWNLHTPKIDTTKT